ncbi:MAG: gliding motility lipoprotein GldH [Bacteroidales bacterium]|nr:gliding motility lipoprotein GldH [Bacteroidales bacterium]MCF8404877.1 gliding motility lipoprotein GldH [Bacteroidales bacterium]
MKNSIFCNSKLLPVLLLLVVLQSCNPDSFFEKNKVVKKASWDALDTIQFRIDVLDTLQAYNFYLNVRHNTDYSYSNLYLFVGIRYPDKTYSRDTIELILARPDGKWLGKGFGKLKENNILIKKGLQFPYVGLYRFDFQQAMREETLKGIEDVGIRLEKIN